MVKKLIREIYDNQLPEERKMAEMLTPKFLTKELAIIAVNTALNAVLNDLWLTKRMGGTDCHIVILVPGMEDARATDYPDWPNYPLSPVLLYEHSVGDPEKWILDFKSIAMCKALQIWTDRNFGSGPLPHLLFPSDTPFWGGVKREGIVVACSGFKQWFDRMVASMIADMLIALARHGYEEYMEHREKWEAFLP